MTKDWRQTDVPHFQLCEFGVPFAPDYGYDRPPVKIDPAEWKHLCTARFGESRPTGWGGKTKWTGNSYRYDIFERIDDLGRHVAMRWYNGGGEGWLLTEDNAKRGEASMLDLIVSVSDENRRWDYCHFLYETAHKSVAAGSLKTERELKKAFVEGRLKKRKKRGEYSVIVEPSV